MQNAMKVEQVDTSALRHAEYNPRILTEKDAKDLIKSIHKFGFIQPLVANSAPGREGVIIGGNQRFEMARFLKITEVPVVWVNLPNIADEKELNIRLNKNQGRWDYDLLNSEFNNDDLLNWGFTEIDLGGWSSDIESVEKIIETSSGIESILKIICPQAARETISTKVKAFLASEFPDARLEN